MSIKNRTAFVIVILLAAGGGVFLSDPVAGVAGEVPVVVEAVATEQWRSGDDAAGPIFGLVAQVTRNRQDRVLVLDYIQVKVFVFDSEGVFLREMNIEGDGPGEVHKPTQLFVAPDGGLGVVQMSPGKVELLDQDGVYDRTLHVVSRADAEPVLTQIYDAWLFGSGFILTAEQIFQTERGRSRRNFVGVFGGDGVESRTLYEIVREETWPDFSFREDEVHTLTFRMVAVGADGMVYVPTARNRIEVTGFDASGDAVVRLEETVTPRRRTEAERRFLRRYYEWQATGAAHVDIAVSEAYPVVESMRVAETGDLWVTVQDETCAEARCAGARIHVFEKTGKLKELRTVSLPGEHPSGRVYWLSDDSFALVTGIADALDEFKMMRLGSSEAPRDLYDSPMEVVVYDVRWRR